VSAGGALAAACVAVSRLYLHVHTGRQVVVGGALGVVLGLLWFALVEALRPAFAWLADSALGRALRLRDCSDCDVLTLEYEAIVGAVAAQRRAAAAAAAAAAAVAAAGGKGGLPPPSNPPTSAEAKKTE
jgi:hypothetical protein